MADVPLHSVLSLKSHQQSLDALGVPTILCMQRLSGVLLGICWNAWKESLRDFFRRAAALRLSRTTPQRTEFFYFLILL